MQAVEDGHDQVIVVRRGGVAVDLDAEESYRTGGHAEDQSVEERRLAQQPAILERPADALDPRPAWWSES